jgi:tetratricopeptide (TPR) repeat protein
MRATSIAVLSFALTMPKSASADPPAQAERDVARAIAQSGATYFDEGDWERAREHYHRAYDLVKAPTLALMEARALVKLGHFVEATEAYTRAMSIDLDETREPFRRAAVDARVENEALQPRVPSIRVTWREQDSPTEVRLDGQVVSKDALRSAMPLNPGTHVVAVTRRGSPDSWESVTVGEGEERTVAIEPSLQADLAPSRSPLRPFMWAAFVTGGAGLAVGIVSGVLAVDRKSKLDELCSGSACPATAESTLQSYRDYKTASKVGYVAGFVGVATGAVLFAVAPRASPQRPQVGAFVSPSQSGVVVAGEF